MREGEVSKKKTDVSAGRCLPGRHRESYLNIGHAECGDGGDARSRDSGWLEAEHALQAGL